MNTKKESRGQVYSSIILFDYGENAVGIDLNR